MTTPAKTSVGWCMPRYTRAKPTATGMTTAAAHASARQATRVVLAVTTTATRT